MPTYTQYQKSNGANLWRVTGYLGVNPETKKQVNINKGGFLTQKAAKAYYRQVSYDILKNGFQNHKDATFKEIYELWLETYELTVKESSFVKLKQKFDIHILPTFGEKEIKKIGVSDVQKFANAMREKNTQFKEYVSNVSRIFDFAIKQGYVSENPAKKIVMPRKKKNLQEKEINFYTKDELKKLLEYAKNNEPFQIYTFFFLLANTGCRQGEILGLQWDCINFEEKVLTIKQTLTRGKNRRQYLEEPKTKKSRRKIPLTDETISILKKWRLIQKEECLKLGVNIFDGKQFVFCDEKGEPIQLSHPRLWLHRISKRAGIPKLSPHALRHAFATILIGQGINFKTVSELLGHSSVSMTLDTYAGVYQEEKIDSINLLANALS